MKYDPELDEYGNVIGCPCPDSGCGCEWPDDTVTIIISREDAEEVVRGEMPFGVLTACRAALEETE